DVQVDVLQLNLEGLLLDKYIAAKFLVPQQNLLAPGFERVGVLILPQGARIGVPEMERLRIVEQLTGLDGLLLGLDEGAIVVVVEVRYLIGIAPRLHELPG